MERSSSHLHGMTAALELVKSKSLSVLKSVNMRLNGQDSLYCLPLPECSSGLAEEALSVTQMFKMLHALDIHDVHASKP